MYSTGYDLRWMLVDASDGLLNEGRNLVIVALVGTELHIRIFDANGKRVIDKAENELISGETLKALKKQLNPLPDESGLSQEEKQKFVRNATSIAGHTHSTDGEKKSIIARGLVITGPGPSKKPQNINVPHHAHLLYGDNFWEKADWVGSNLRYNGDDPVVVVGGGETAASVVSTLIDIIGRRAVSIVVLTRGGTIFTRGEGYYENRMFTDHESWAALSEKIRQEVIDRTDRGVFSVEIARKIALAHNVDHRAIEITGVEVDANEHNILSIEGKDGKGIDRCQLLVLAFGFDAYWFTQLLDARTREAFSDESKRKQVEESLRNDLSVNDEHVQGKLHLPMVAGLKQGPGFPNLSCLGHLADVIVETYV